MPQINRRRFLFTLGSVGSLVGLAPMWLPGHAASHPGTQATGNLGLLDRPGRALGTQVHISVWHEQPSVAEAALADAFSELELVERTMSLYRPDSQLSRLNRNGILESPHPYLLQVLHQAQSLSQQTVGAFDVTVQPLWEVYAAAKKHGSLPSTDAIQQARAKVDWRQLEVSETHIRFQQPGMAATLNGIAQGFAGDRVASALRKHEIQHALVNTGEVQALGTKPNQDAWKVGVQHPRVADAYAALVALQGGCMATSGDYATQFSADHAHHHIFDPTTGQSPRAFSSVTIYAPTGLQADAFSTAIFVLGPDKGLELVRSTPSIEAMFVLKDGSVSATDGFPTVS